MAWLPFQKQQKISICGIIQLKLDLEEHIKNMRLCLYMLPYSHRKQIRFLFTCPFHLKGNLQLLKGFGPLTSVVHSVGECLVRPQPATNPWKNTQKRIWASLEVFPVGLIFLEFSRKEKRPQNTKKGTQNIEKIPGNKFLKFRVSVRSVE